MHVKKIKQKVTVLVNNKQGGKDLLKVNANDYLMANCISDHHIMLKYLHKWAER